MKDKVSVTVRAGINQVRLMINTLDLSGFFMQSLKDVARQILLF